MKVAIVLLFIFCYAECRKTSVPIDKHVNIDFINMEGGGGARPNKGVPPAPIPINSKVAQPGSQNIPSKDPPSPKPPSPIQKPMPPVHPPIPTPSSVNPAQPPKTNQVPLIKPKPVNPEPVKNPITTPGPGSVKQLINFYDSQGRASPIRPYSYSQAVKQG